MMVGILAMMSFNLVDTWFVAQLGGASLAAMSFTFPVVILLISLGVGLMAGTSSVIARALGKGDHERVRSLTTHALILGFGLALLCTVLGLLTLDPLFRFLGATEALIPLIRDYMTVWYTGFVFFLVPMVGMAAIRAAGDTRLQSTTMIGAALVNVVLDPLLIFGLAGLPRLELQGAAAATVLARLLTVGVCYWALRHKMHMLTFTRPRVSRVLDSWGAVLHVGFPAAGTNMIIPLSGGVVVAMLAEQGTEAVAGFGAATRIEGLVLVVFYAMSSIIGPFVGQNLGAGKPDRIREAMRDSALFCAGLGLGLAAVLGLTATGVMGLFSDETAVVAVGVAYLLIVPISYGAEGVVMVANAAFNGLGRPLPAVVISALRVIVIYLPAAYVGGRWFGVYGIFGALSISNIMCGLLAYGWYQHACTRIERQRAPAVCPPRRCR